VAATAELLISPVSPDRGHVLSKRVHESVDLSGVSDPDSGLDGSCSCGCAEAPLTAEPPLADVAPLTSEPPLGELPLTSEPTGAGYATEPSDV
jgi:hypothetical protein